jgi:hypothetical protein
VFSTGSTDKAPNVTGIDFVSKFYYQTNGNTSKQYRKYSTPSHDVSIANIELPFMMCIKRISHSRKLAKDELGILYR